MKGLEIFAKKAKKCVDKAFFRCYISQARKGNEGAAPAEGAEKFFLVKIFLDKRFAVCYINKAAA